MVPEAVQSVLDQDYDNVEHIITDGGSTDGTLAVLGRYPHLRVYSEPDKNLYDALNKGILLSKGDVIGHLNTDDYYTPNVFGAVARAFAEDESLDAVFGGALIFEDDSGGGRRVVREWNRSDDLDLNIPRLATCAIHTNARFYRRRVYDRLGLYDIRYPIGADFDFLFRLSLAGVRSRFLPVVVYNYRQHPGSLTFNDVGIVPRVARDMLALSERYSRTRGLRASDRRALLRMHSTFSLGLFYYYLTRGRLADCLHTTLGGIRVDPLWPAYFGKAAFNLIRKKLLGLPLYH